MIPLLDDFEACVCMLSVLYFAFGSYPDVKQLIKMVHTFCEVEDHELDAIPRRLKDQLKRSKEKGTRFISVAAKAKSNKITEDSANIQQFQVEVSTKQKKDTINLELDGDSVGVVLSYESDDISREMVNITIKQRTLKDAKGLSRLLQTPSSFFLPYEQIEEACVPLRETDLLQGGRKLITRGNFIFDITSKLLKRDPSQYETMAQKKDRLSFEKLKFLHDFEMHGQLYYYIFTTLYNQRDRLPISKAQWKRDLERSKFDIIMREHAFQSGLTPEEADSCLDAVRREMLGDYDVDLNQIKYKYLEIRLKSGQLVDTTRTDHKDFNATPAEKVKALQNRTKPFTGEDDEQWRLLTDDLVATRMLKWNLGGNWCERSIYNKTKYDESRHDGILLDDVDLTETETVLVKSDSFFSYPIFHRISSTPSWNFLPINSRVRRFIIHLYTHRHYSTFIIFATLANFFGISGDAELSFMFLFTLDFLIGTSARGLFFSPYAYLRSIWNVFDFLSTLVEILHQSHILLFVLALVHGQYAAIRIHIQSGKMFRRVEYPIFEEEPVDSVYNFELGLVTLARSWRFFRLIKALKNVALFQQLRIILKILFSVIVRSMPMVILLICILLNASIIARDVLAESMYNVCLNSTSPDHIELRALVTQWELHPCSNSSNPFAYTCPTDQRCGVGGHESIVYNHDLYLTFDDIKTSFMILALFIANEDFDAFFYRIVYQTGALGFVAFVSLLLFGNYVYDLVLGLVYDTYDSQVESEKRFPADNVHHYDGEMEFCFDTEDLYVCPYDAVVGKDNGNIGNEYIVITPQELGEETLFLAAKSLKTKAELDAHLRKQQKGFTLDTGRFSKVFENLRNFMAKKYVRRSFQVVVLFQFILILCDHYDEQYQMTNYLFSSWSETIESMICTFFVVEMLSKLFAHGIGYFGDGWHLFDAFIALFTIVHEVQKLNLIPDVVIGNLRFFRIQSLLVRHWLAMKTIFDAIKNSATEVMMTSLLFILVFVYLTVLSLRLLGTYEGTASASTIAEFHLGFGTIRQAARTVFLNMFPSAWQETLKQFMESTERTLRTREDPDKLIQSPTFISLIPNSFYIMLVTMYVCHLLIVNLLVPQLFNQLDVDHLLIAGKDRNQPQPQGKRKTTKSKAAAKTLFGWNMDQIKYGDAAIRVTIDSASWRMAMICLLFVNTLYNWLNTAINEERSRFSRAWFLLGFILQLIFLLDLLMHMAGEGVLCYFRSRTSNYHSWKTTIAVIDIVTILCSFMDLILGHAFHIHSPYLAVGVNLSVLRIVSRTYRLRLWFQNLVYNWKGVLNVFAFVLFVVVFYAIIGVETFGGRMVQCSYSRAGGYNWRSSVRNVIPWRRCQRRQTLERDIIILPNSSYVFNFDNVLDGSQTVLSLIYGDNIWGISTLMTSVTGRGMEPVRGANRSAWVFLFAVIIGGFFIDALIFLVIGRTVEDKSCLPKGSVWRTLDDPKRRKTFLTLEYIKSIAPWQMIPPPASYIGGILHSVIKHHMYDKFILLVMVFHIFTIGLNIFDDYYEGKVELYLLFFYLLDGIVRLTLVGKTILFYPQIIIFDIVLPLILCSVVLSRAKIHVRPSLFMMLRMAAPDRYIRFELLRPAKLILKALVTSLSEQIYMLLALFIFIASFANIGVNLFRFTDTFGYAYQPVDVPPSYVTLPSAFTHLSAIAFGNYFDTSISHMEVRSRFCKKHTPLKVMEIAEKQLRSVLAAGENMQNPSLIICSNNSVFASSEAVERLASQIRSGARKVLGRFFDVVDLKINTTALTTRLDEAMEEAITRGNTGPYCDPFRPTYRSALLAILQPAIGNFTIHGDDCASSAAIRFFYFIFIICVKLIVLNLLKNVVLTQYRREKARHDTGINENDLVEYIEKWNKFSTRMGNYGSYMPIRYALFFVAVHAPRKFKMIGKTEEEIQLVFVKYRLPVRERDMYVHAVDIMSVCLAATFNCDEDVDLRLMINNLAPYILRVYDDYAFDERKTIPMSNFIKGYYFGKIILNAFIQRTIKNKLTINLRDPTEEKKGRYFEENPEELTVPLPDLE